MIRERRKAVSSALRERLRCMATEEITQSQVADSAEDIYVRALWRILNSREDSFDRETNSSCMETLLEWVPSMNPVSGEFQLTEHPNDLRKCNGSYYTPRTMIERLLDYTLNPLLASKKSSQEVLNMRVCDPSCGAGDFLIASAERIAKRVKALDAEEGISARGHILTDVIRRCVYGVDKNPLAVKLCRLRLGSMTVNPSFVQMSLEEHIRIADSLDGLNEDNNEFRWSIFLRRSMENGSENEPYGFDAVIGNPPYLFGKNKPRVDVSRFQLAKGQWDASWLFIELAANHLLKRDGSLGFVLPDSILARFETRIVREFLAKRFDTLEIEHVRTGFDADVSVILLSGCNSHDPSLTLHHGSHFMTVAGKDSLELSRLPWTRNAFLSSINARRPLRLGDIAEVIRGEECGKRGLPLIKEPCDPLLWAPALAGEGVKGCDEAPNATHWIPRLDVRKPLAIYRSPKIVIVKTGKTLRACIDRNELITLQSVYNLHLKEDAPPWLRLEGLCEYLNSDECNAQFITPYTSGKAIFPQITLGMVREIRLSQEDVQINEPRDV